MSVFFDLICLSANRKRHDRIAFLSGDSCQECNSHAPLSCGSRPLRGLFPMPLEPILTPEESMKAPSGSPNQNPGDGFAAIRHLHYRIEVFSYGRAVLLRNVRDEAEDLTFHLSPSVAERLANRLFEAARLGLDATASRDYPQPGGGAL
jgi:hypothetical protein